MLVVRADQIQLLALPILLCYTLFTLANNSSDLIRVHIDVSNANPITLLPLLTHAMYITRTHTYRAATSTLEFAAQIQKTRHDNQHKKGSYLEIEIPWREGGGDGEMHLLMEDTSKTNNAFF